MSDLPTPPPPGRPGVPPPPDRIEQPLPLAVPAPPVVDGSSDERPPRRSLVVGLLLVAALAGAVAALWVWLAAPSACVDREVRSDRSLVKAAVEETLRWAGPVGTSTRQTTRAVELGGVELPERALIGAVLSSANRDPRRWSDPGRFDVHRREGAHLAFAVGTHFCLGAWFGRHLARVSLDVLLDRLPGLRLDPERPVELSGWEFRAPSSTWVRWDPA